ncbi:MAG: bactofilin family protein [Desulfocucumaceae bacterium]
MFGKKKVEEKIDFDKIDTLIGKDTVFLGNISATGTIRIDGAVRGDIKTNGDLVVSDTGKIEADVEARNILMAGYLRGNVIAEGLVDLASTAKLFGDIQVKKLNIEEGALFKGNCLMDTASQDNSQKEEN